MIFQFIGILARDTLDGIRRTHAGNLALVALLAQVLLNLQEKRTVAKTGTALDTLSATVAEGLVDGIFKVGLLYELARDGACWAHQILCRRVQVLHTGTIVSSAQITISAHLVGMETLDGRDG